MRTDIPGPRGGGPLGSLRRLRRNPLEFYTDLAATYGPLARFRLGPHRVHLVSDPEAVGEILMNDVDGFRKGFGNDALEPLIGEGLFLAEGDAWRRQRKLVQPLFKQSHLEALWPIVRRVTEDMLDGWAAYAARGEDFDLFHELRECTLRITSLGLVGTDRLETEPELRATLEELWQMTNARVDRGFPWIEGLFVLRHARFSRASRFLDERLTEIVRDREDRAQDGAQGFDLLGRLLAAQDANGKGLGPRSIRDELVTFLIAGQECTAIALAWAIELLLEHPEHEEAVVEEARGSVAEGFPQPDRVGELRRTRAVIDESMRLYPPAWLMARQANAPRTISGHELPANAILAISPWVMHRSPRFFEDPERFDPDRFVRGKPARFTYIPFAAGPRACIGRPFALLLALAILPAVLLRYRLTLVPNQRIEPAPKLTLRPKFGIRVTASVRSPSGPAPRTAGRLLP